ncbi:hypothetical protein V1477_003101 [Vespula maculifrons]|uniref:Uncharacterized protein n=1 Tax=Vespula maculifrons TaxID=7453 RepID=A0ABD2CWB3_VESMC
MSINQDIPKRKLEGLCTSPEVMYSFASSTFISTSSISSPSDSAPPPSISRIYKIQSMFMNNKYNIWTVQGRNFIHVQYENT